MKIRAGFYNKEQILQQLNELECQDVPPPVPVKKNNRGAMCYSMTLPPEVAEYVCPVCGEKTYYSKLHVNFITNEIHACRREFQNLQKHTDICSLDESSFCSSCCPDATDYSLKLTITYPDGSTVVTTPVYLTHLRVLSGFFHGKFSDTTSTDDSRLLKSELRTLHELLLHGSPPLKQAPEKAPRKKYSGRVPANLVKKLNANEYKIRTVLESMKEKILQDIRLHTDAGNVTAATIEPGADIYDLTSADRDRELYLLLSDRDREKLRDIDEALHRIDTGEYGSCEECGEDIAFGRLMVLPLTRHCVRCKSNLEKQQSKTSYE